MELIYDLDNLAKNENAIHIFEDMLIKEPLSGIRRDIWSVLSTNPNAFHMLEQNLDKVNWVNIWCNPAIFEEEPDYLLK
jgi:hypothetical protein